MASEDLTSKKMDEIKFIYNTPENYNPQFINGVIGGPSTRGEIILNFFFEHSSLPKEEVNKIDAKGITERELPIPMVLRDIKVGIIMSPSVAESIRGFLEEIIKQVAIREKEMATSKALQDETKNITFQ
ncbi:MAG: hypothetical protein WB392_07935 [Methanotrichaceae archaeon]